MSAATDGRPMQCPGCGYQPSSPEDPFFTAYNGKGECPRCGIIPSKVKPIPVQESNAISENSTTHSAPHPGSDPAPANAPEFTAPSMPDDYTGGSAVLENAESLSLQTPTLNQRFHAYLITSSLAAIPAAIGHLLIVFSIASFYGDKFIVVNNNMFFRSVSINETAQGFIVLLSLAVSLGFAIYQFVVIPSESGATRGEQRRGIAIVDQYGNEALGIGVFARRFAGLLINTLTFLPLLLPLFHSRKNTLPDLLSKSRPVILTGATSSSWGVILLALLLSAGSQGIVNWHINSLLTDALKPRRPAISSMEAFNRMGAVMAASSEKHLEKDLGRMLELQKQEHGFYTDDAEELLMNYGNQVAGNRTPIYMAAAVEGRISIEIQGDSYRISLAPPSPVTKRREFRE